MSRTLCRCAMKFCKATFKRHTVSLKNLYRAPAHVVVYLQLDQWPSSLSLRTPGEPGGMGGYVHTIWFATWMTDPLQSNYFEAGYTKLGLITPEAQLRTC